jgi:cell division transport system permease protein
MSKKSAKMTVLSPQPNYWLTVVSLAIVLLIGGIPLFLGWQVPQLVRYIQDNSTIGVSFNSEITDQQRDSVVQILEKKKVVDKKLTWVDREKAWEMMQSDFPEMIENPLFSMLLFKLNEGWEDLAFLHQLERDLQELPFVDKVHIPPVQFQQVRHSIRRASIVLGIVAIAALLGAVLLIYFTIRLSIYDKRFSIRTLELVGADWDFIQRPFVKRGLRIGFLSAIIATVSLLVCLFYIGEQYPALKAYVDIPGIIWSITIIGLIGPFTGLMTSLFTVNKFLQGGLDEFFNT